MVKKLNTVRYTDDLYFNNIKPLLILSCYTPIQTVMLLYGFTYYRYSCYCNVFLSQSIYFYATSIIYYCKIICYLSFLTPKSKSILYCPVKSVKKWISKQHLQVLCSSILEYFLENYSLNIFPTTTDHYYHYSIRVRLLWTIWTVNKQMKTFL